MESDVLLTYRPILSQVLAVSSNVGVKRPTLYGVWRPVNLYRPGRSDLNWSLASTVCNTKHSSTVSNIIETKKNPAKTLN